MAQNEKAEFQAKESAKLRTVDRTFEGTAGAAVRVVLTCNLLSIPKFEQKYFLLAVLF